MPRLADFRRAGAPIFSARMPVIEAAALYFASRANFATCRNLIQMAFSHLPPRRARGDTPYAICKISLEILLFASLAFCFGYVAGERARSPYLLSGQYARTIRRR